MSTMSNLSQEIQEMIDSGHSPRIISKILEIPINWVLAQSEEVAGPSYFRDRDEESMDWEW